MPRLVGGVLHSAYKTGRPEFGQMCAYIEEHPDTNTVLVYKIDRIARNLLDYSRLTEGLGVTLISTTEGVLDNSTGRMLGTIQAAVSTQFSEQLGERVKLGQQTKASKGLFPGPAPDGYKTVDKRLVVDENRSRIVQELFDVYENPEMTLARLAQYAKLQAFLTRRGKPFAISSLKYILNNPIYYGDFVWKADRCPGVHEPLISKAQFDRVQQKLTRKTKIHVPYIFVYKSLLTCHNCGSGITAEFKKDKKYTYYHCTGGKGICEVKRVNVREEIMSDRLAPVIHNLRMNDDRIRYLVEEMRKAESGGKLQRGLETRRLRSELERIQADRIQAYRDKVQGVITPSFGQMRIKSGKRGSSLLSPESDS